MAVRAKFVCVETGHPTRFLVVTSGSEENERFWQYTPGGEIILFIDNPEAEKQFETGKEYYVDFTLAG